jgi:hypothetical protein
MKNIELKSKLLEEIKNSEDYQVLEEVYKLLNLESESFEVFKFSERQEKSILKAKQQIKNGDFLTEEEANKEIDKWLEE